MAIPNHKQLDPAREAQPLDLAELAPSGDAPPHELQRMLIDRLGISSGVVFPEPPGLSPRVERLIETASRLGGVALFGAALLGVIWLMF